MYEIKLKIHNESDLYNPLDPKKEVLSDEVISFLEKKYIEKTDLLEKITICILSDEDVDEERIKRNFKNFVDRELLLLQKQKNRSLFKQIRLLVIGIIFIALWLFLETITESVFATVVCIVGWFAVWEAANVWFVEFPEYRMKKLRFQLMQKTEMIFFCGVEFDNQ